ncbi:hypothetical protein BDR06DRAFT_1014781 [Suillus hirtellus]|nr:hypothetical protein BDR06DRAFT_1014781 [Suillus hirtellus]
MSFPASSSPSVHSACSSTGTSSIPPLTGAITAALGASLLLSTSHTFAAEPTPLIIDQDKEIPDAPAPEPQTYYQARYKAPLPDPDKKPSEDSKDSEEDMPRPVEKKIGTLPDFNRERDTSSKFIQLVHLYLSINNKIYVSDTEKINFTLSFFKGGAAAT